MTAFYRFSWRLVRTLFRVFFGFKSVGSEHVPPDGPLILASNHRSYLDPPLLGISLEREVHFLAKAELFAFGPFGRLITALNAHPVRRGQRDTTAVEGMVELLREGKVVVIFPEGTRQKVRMRSVQAKSGVSRLAQATGAPIQVAYVEGSGEKWKALLRLRPLRVYFGPIIQSEEYREYGSSTKGYRTLAKTVIGEIERLGREVEENRNAGKGLEDPNLGR
jgi:1-acyl-sn-glycerol-3-phosphate acyltransferase